MSHKETEFAKALEQIKNLAKEQENCVSQEQIKACFAEWKLNNEQLQLVYDYLAANKIGIGKPVNLDDYLSDEERDYLQDYLEEIAALPTYTEGEKYACTLSAMAGDKDAQNRLIEMHLQDVVEIAKLYAGQGVFLEDLIGEGNVALALGVTMSGSLETAEKAEGMLAKGIMDAMEEYIKEHVDNEKADKKVVDKVNKVSEAAKELAGELKHKITAEELSRETGMSVKAIRDAMRMSGYRIEEME